MKKRLKKNIDLFKLILFISLFVMSFSITIELYKSRHSNEYKVQKTEYKFYLKNPDTGKYEEQTSLIFPGDQYYLDIDKTNSECATSTIDQNDDLSVKALISFSTVCDLYYNPNGILTVTANVSTATATIKIGNDVIATGTVPVSAGVGKGKNVTITVSDPEYYYTQTNNTYNDYEETFEMSGEDTTKTITLNERPWITGSIANTSSTTARTYTTTNWHPGYYLIEAWGGKGGSSSANSGGDAGYIYGVVYIPYNTTIYATAGGNGTTGGAAAGGANGGGTAGSDTLSSKQSSGGGYTAFAVGAAAINATNINNGIVKLIAGAGGGCSGNGGMLGQYSGANGGAGGKMTNTKSTTTLGTVFSGSDGETARNTGQGYGGSTTGGGSSSGGGSTGALLTGGNANQRGGGGGAGYYGGGGGDLARYPNNNGPGGGGGGSSFIANGVTYSNLPSSVTSKLTPSCPSSTGGAIKIQWIGKTFP